MTISPINLGSFYTNSSGATVSSGLSSGINTDTLITALTASQTAQVTKLTDQVTVNNKQITSLTTLNQTLTALQTAIKTLNNPQSLDTTNNLFAVRTSSITSNTAQAASNYISATVTSGTASGTYTITDVSQLATKASQETNAFALGSADDSVVRSNPTATGFFAPGKITINGQDITINDGDSLSNIAQSFNNVSSTTGLSASVLQTSAGRYKLIFTSTTSGAASNFDLGNNTTVTADPDGVLSHLTFVDDTEGFDASFKLNNVQISRATNDISDLIGGVTLTLQQDTVATPGASFTLTVAPDVDSITAGVTNFAAAYNNFLFFYSQQTQVDPTTGVAADSATLFNDTALKNIYNSVTGIAASLVKGIASGQPATLSAIGVGFSDYAGSDTIPATPNTLTVDSSALKSLLTTNLTGVENVFGDSFTSSSSNIALYQAPTNSTVTNFKLSVVNSAVPPTYTATYTDAGNATQTVQLTGTPFSSGGGYALKGATGSVFEGMTLLYNGTGDESNIDVTIAQGLLVTMNNQVTAAVKTTSGSIAQDQQSITDKNTALNKQVTTINDQTAQLKTSLLAKYSALEQAITKANSVLSLLNAQQLAGKS